MGVDAAICIRVFYCIKRAINANMITMNKHTISHVAGIIFFLFLSITKSYSQTTVTIGTGISATGYYPIDRYYNYSVWEGIYLSSELTYSGTISELKFYKNATDGGSNITALTVYMKQTTATSLGDGSWSTSGYTQVFSGTLTNGTSAGWKTFSLSSPFNYSNGSNLSILIVHNYQYYTSNYPLWRYTTVSPNKSRFNSSDYSLPSSLYYTSGRPNIQVTFSCLAPTASAGSNKSICNGDTVAIGGSPSATGGSGSGYVYSWSPSSGLSSTTASNPEAYPTVTTTYSLTVTDGAGCVSTASGVKVYVSGSGNDYRMNDGITHYVSGGNFYDSGGSGSGYTYSEDDTITFYPCGSACNKVRMAFSSFDLESQATCNYDWLKIYNGPSTSSPLIGTYCGTSSPGTVTSTHSTGALTYVFHSDASVTAAGWAATISNVSGGPTASAGTNKYLCNTDSVQIGGAPTASGGSGSGYTYVWSPSTGLSSSTEANPYANPTATTTYTVTVTDGAGCASSLSSMTVYRSGANTPYLMSGGTTYTTSAGKFYDSGGSSGSYTYNENKTTTFYPCNSCEKLKFTFTSFDTEDGLFGCYDELKIYNGPSTASPLVGTYCGTSLPPAVTSTHSTGALTFVFTSDGSVTYSGWAADITTVSSKPVANAGLNKSICNGSNTTIGGSPTASGGSGSGYTYLWIPSTGLSSSTVANPTASPTTTTTYKLVVSDGAGCVSDTSTVTVYVSGSTTAYLANQSSINYLVTGGKFYDSGGEGGSYMYSEDYTTTFTTCEADRKVQLQFNSFDLEYNSTCNWDWMKIYDGPNTSAPLLGTWCGTNSPGTITSTHSTGTLTVVFHSDLSVTASGWDATIKTYYIKPLAHAGENKSICSGDSVIIGANPAASRGNGTGYTYLWSPATGLSSTTVENPTAFPTVTTVYSLVVRDSMNFASDTSKMTVYVNGANTAYLANQNGTYYATGGKFYDSGGATGSYTYNQDYKITFFPCGSCKKLQFTFTAFDVETQTSCNFDYLKIYDGPDTSSTLIGTYCGTSLPPVITSTHATGGITFVWHSDISITGAGWAADIAMLDARPIAEAGLNYTVCPGVGIQIGGNPTASGGSIGEYTYLWSPATGLSSASESNPVATLTEAQKYYVEVTSSNNCTSLKDSTEITISSDTSSYYAAQSKAVYYVTGGKFYDRGGVNGGYVYNEIDTLTFYPCDTTKYVNLNFTFFDLEYSSTCSYDYMKIYNGPTTGSPLIGTWCSNQLSGNIASTHSTGALTIVFVSDYILSGDGWEADISLHCNRPTANAGIDYGICQGGDSIQIGSASPASGGSGSGYTYVWTPVTGLSNPAATSPMALPVSSTSFELVVTDGEGCSSAPAGMTVYVNNENETYATNRNGVYHVSGGKFYDSGGSGSSYEYYEHYYTTFLPCNPYDKISLVFNSFDLEYSATCSYDYMKIFNGSDTNSTLLGIWCDTIADTIRSTHSSGALTVLFHSDYSITGDGWDADILSTDLRPVAHAGNDTSICAGDSITLGAAIAATGGSGTGYTYQWTPSTGLNADTVSNPVASPIQTTTYLLVVTDSNGIPSVSDSVTVFVSGDSVDYYAERNMIYHITDGQFYDSGKLESSYSNNENRTIVFYPCNSFRKIKAVFNDFDVKEGDLFKIYDGPDIASPFLGSFNIKDPSTIISSHVTGALTFVFESDSINTGSGWDVTLSGVCDNPMAHAGLDKSICPGSQDTIGALPSASGGWGGYTFVWIPGTGLNDSTAANPIASPRLTTEYMLEVTDTGGGVSATDKITVYVSSDTTEYYGKTNMVHHVTGGTFYDSGGESGNFGMAEQYVVTFMPCDTMKRVVLDFNAFNLGIDTVSKTNWMKIYNGSGISSPLIGTYYNDSNPGIIYSTDSTGSLTVEFRSDKEDLAAGWKAEIRSECHNFPIANAGLDKSICYGQSDTLGWNPTATGGGGLYNYHWIPSSGLNLDSVSNPIATPDITTKYYLNVIDQWGCNAPIDSVVVFVSSDSTKYYGNTDMVYHVSGGTFYDSGGKEGDYSNNENYSLTFLPCDSAQIVNIKFNKFSLEKDADCNFESLTIYDGINTNSPIIGFYCGLKSPGIITPTNPAGALTVVFKSDSSVIGKGWEADIFMSDKRCVGVSGNTVLSNHGDSCNAGATTLELISNSALFSHWQYSYNNITYNNIYGGNLNPFDTIINNTTYFRAVVILDSIECYSTSDVYYAGNNYYVNDNAVSDVFYTTGIGSNDNDGRTPATPFASVSYIMENFEIGPCDNIFADVYKLPGSGSINYDDPLPCSDKNWVYNKAFNSSGGVAGALITFMDLLGRPQQTQVLDIEKNNVLASQIIFDEFGRNVLQTLQAPIFTTTGISSFKTNFIQNAAGNSYNYFDFDMLTIGQNIGNINNPEPVKLSEQGTLGWYYSNANTMEPYTPATSFPYSRVEYFPDLLGRVKRVSQIGNKFKLGSGHETKVFYLNEGGELAYVFGTYKNALKTISVDPDNKTFVTYTDNAGKPIASCRSGVSSNTNIQTVRHLVNKSTGYTAVIHLPSPRKQTLKIPRKSSHLCQGVDNLLFRIFDIDNENKELVRDVDFLITNPTTFLGDRDIAFIGSYALPDRDLFLKFDFFFNSSVCYTDAMIYPDIVLKYELDYSDWALNYYDDITGELIKTVPPAGVDYGVPFLETYNIDGSGEDYGAYIAYVTEPPTPFQYNQADAGSFLTNTDIPIFFLSNEIASNYGMPLLNNKPFNQTADKDNFNQSLVFNIQIYGKNAYAPNEATGNFCGYDYNQLDDVSIEGIHSKPLFVNTSTWEQEQWITKSIYDPCLDLFHCTNNVQDCGETSINQGGDCILCTYPGGHCFNGLQDCGETGVDEGGNCPPTPDPDVITEQSQIAAKYRYTILIQGSSTVSGTPDIGVENYNRTLTFEAVLYRNPNCHLNWDQSTLSMLSAEFNNYQMQNLDKFEIFVESIAYQFPGSNIWTEIPNNPINNYLHDFARSLNFKISYHYKRDPIAIPSFSHSMVTEFEYNNMRKLVAITTPDEGKDEFVYTTKGNVRFSQNAEQKLHNRFTYFNYDKLGRLTETGEYDPTGSASPIVFVAEKTFDQVYPTGSTHQIKDNPFSFSQPNADGLDDNFCKGNSFYFYDKPEENPTGVIGFQTLTSLFPTLYKQRFLAGRLSKTWNNEVVTWYSYDDAGRIEWTVQYYMNMGTLPSEKTKTIHYEYDFFGNVTNVIYQKNKPTEYFEHIYTYDANSKLKSVVTRNFTQFNSSGAKSISNDGSISNIFTEHIKEQAEYEYYLHGPLKRVELAGNLQGIDYVYTENGWLKSINHPGLNSVSLSSNPVDPGADGFTGSQNMFFHPDVFGMSIDYFKDDYKKTIGQNLHNRGTYIGYGNNTGDIFSGNVKSARWNIRNQQTVTPLSPGDDQWVYYYNYNYRNHLQNAIFNSTFSDLTQNGDVENIPDINPQDITMRLADIENALEILVNEKGLSPCYTTIMGNCITNMEQLDSLNSDSLIIIASAIIGTMKQEADKIDAQMKNIIMASRIATGDTIAIPDSIFFVQEVNNIKIALTLMQQVNAMRNSVAPYNNNLTNLMPYNEHQIMYDLNGNLTSLSRNGYDGSALGFPAATLPMDVLNYNYQANTNKLINVADLNSVSNGYPDIKPGQLQNNYTYNLSGQMIGNEVEDKYFKYTHFGLMEGVYSSELEQNIRMKFAYNESGYKIKTKDYGLSTETWLLRDAAGNVLCIYEKPFNGTLQLKEIPVYGASRLGVFEKQANRFNYELTDHTGNVRAVVTDQNGNLEMLACNDYYPYGMEMPGRGFVASQLSGSYRFGMQGQEKLFGSSVISFNLRTYDARLGRWMQTDPYGQHFSPYLAFSNNPVSFIDPTGGTDYMIDGVPVSGFFFFHYANNNTDNINTPTGTDVRFFKIIIVKCGSLNMEKNGKLQFIKNL